MVLWTPVKSEYWIGAPREREISVISISCVVASSIATTTTAVPTCGPSVCCPRGCHPCVYSGTTYYCIWYGQTGYNFYTDASRCTTMGSSEIYCTYNTTCGIGPGGHGFGYGNGCG
ncbi:unnamed protein product [Adineta steineri]|uniref:Uncharacterized protein n=1 Tax=Adineta steineri TaxID=433720 RepID=A0A819G440_9BILA|nr:unnamed protein product [Adineta steineri]CAF3879367.1 unnamed protein product [Adineta steineri]